MSAEGVELVWKGKRAGPLLPGALPVLRCVERVGEQDAHAVSGRLIQGDNLLVMTALMPELAGRFRLIYLDPPFFTGVDWFVSDHRQTRSQSGSKQAAAFSDVWNNDLSAYLQWLYDRLVLCRELLCSEGVLYLHLNWQAAHYAKLLLDEIFGIARFQNEIIWCYREAINSKKRWNRKHDTILMYSKGEQFAFNCDAVREPYAASGIRKYRHKDEKGVYRLMGRGITDSPLRSKRDLPPEYEVKYPGLTYRHYLGEGTLPVDYWHIDIENQASPRRTGYPTQKPEALLERILLASSHENELIGDFCCGSGTTLAVAQRLNRLWVGCDVGTVAVETTRNRLAGIINDSETGFRVEHIAAEASGGCAQEV